MKGWIALTVFVLVALFALTYYDPEAHNRVVIGDGWGNFDEQAGGFVIDEPDQK